ARLAAGAPLPHTDAGRGRRGARGRPHLQGDRETTGRFVPHGPLARESDPRKDGRRQQRPAARPDLRKVVPTSAGVFRPNLEGGFSMAKVRACGVTSKSIALAALVAMTLATVGLAEPDNKPGKGGPPPSDLSVTTEIQDLDAQGNVCTISSDGQGAYHDGVN